MEIIWDPEKQERLKRERGIDLDEIKGLIENHCYFDILENPSKPGQYLIALEYQSYIHIAVVKIEPDKMIIKTCYPSRKAGKKYARRRQ
jgi:uncharacterized DUF497 family protein